MEGDWPGIDGRQGRVTKRRLHLLPLVKKLEILEAVRKGGRSKKAIAVEYGIPTSTLSTFLSKEASIREAVVKINFQPNRKRMQKVCYGDMEYDLLRWFRNLHGSHGHVSGAMWIQKATELAKNIGYTDVHISPSWIDRFKERHGIARRSKKRKLQQATFTSGFPAVAIASGHSSNLNHALNTQQSDRVTNVTSAHVTSGSCRHVPSTTQTSQDGYSLESHVLNIQPEVTAQVTNMTSDVSSELNSVFLDRHQNETESKESKLVIGVIENDFPSFIKSEHHFDQNYTTVPSVSAAQENLYDNSINIKQYKTEKVWDSSESTAVYSSAIDGGIAENHNEGPAATYSVCNICKSRGKVYVNQGVQTDDVIIVTVDTDSDIQNSTMTSSS